MKLYPPRRLSEIAEVAEREIKRRLSVIGGGDIPFPVEVGSGGETIVTSVCPIENIETGCLTFAIGKDYLSQADASEAAAIIVPLSASSEKAHLRAPEPRLVFSVVMELCGSGPSLIPGEASGVKFKDKMSVSIGEGAVIGDWSYIGKDVIIGKRCRIYPHVYLDDQVTIGDDCVVYPHVTVFRRTQIGQGVIVHAGAVIGDDGFGYNQIPGRGRLFHVKNEHLGGVVIEDYVEIGSNACIDRGLAGNTVIGEGTKIDNLVQIAHNVKIGKDCIIVSQVGLAGNSKLGNRVFALGKSGVSQGISVGDDAIMNARASVMSDIPSGRTLWAGHPAQKSESEFRQIAMIRKDLPRMRDFFHILKKATSFEEMKAAFLNRQQSENEEENRG